MRNIVISNQTVKPLCDSKLHCSPNTTVNILLSNYFFITQFRNGPTPHALHPVTSPQRFEPRPPAGPVPRPSPFALSSRHPCPSWPCQRWRASHPTTAWGASVMKNRTLCSVDIAPGGSSFELVAVDGGAALNHDLGNACSSKW